LGCPYCQEGPQREQHTDQRLGPNGAAEQLQRHHAQELAILSTVVAAGRQRLAPRLHRGEMFRLDHATAQECQQKRRNDAGEKDVAPPVGADPIVDIGGEQIAKASAGHHKAEDLSPVRLGKSFGDQRDRDHQLRARAEPGDEAKQAELPNLLREPLQCGEEAVDQDAERQRAHPAEIVGDDAEKEAPERPAQEADRGQQATDRADLCHCRAAAEQLGQGLAQNKPIKREIGDVEGPAGPSHEQHQPLIACDIA